MVKNLPAKAGDIDRSWIPRTGRFPRGRNGNPFQYLSGESHGPRSLMGYSPYGQKESNTTEVTWHTAQLLDNMRKKKTKKHTIRHT